MSSERERERERGRGLLVELSPSLIHYNQYVQSPFWTGGEEEGGGVVHRRAVQRDTEKMKSEEGMRF